MIDSECLGACGARTPPPLPLEPGDSMGDRFNIPRFTAAGEERIRRSMYRGHRGDDPALPIRRVPVRRSGSDFISWVGPVDYDGPEEALWEMEVDFEEFRGRNRGVS